MNLLKKTFEKNFIEHTMLIALPIMLQNGITNFVNMLDNIMVGRIGTDPMTGVSIVNSLSLCGICACLEACRASGFLPPSIAAKMTTKAFGGPSACRFL
jgi:hypothetical protein